MKYRGQTETEKKDAVIGVFGDESSYNMFYDSVSVVFKVASFIIIAAFLLFIVAAAFNNAHEFSYENLEYIVRNFALTLDENKDDTVYSIRYNPDSSRTYSLFGKGLCVSGNSGIAVYSATGRQTCSEIFTYKEPVMVSSEKYALVYDSNSVSYSVYNSFTEVYSSELSHPIKDAAISNEGYYAFISSSDEFSSIVEVYSDNFSLVNRFNKTGYVIDIDISDTKILIATISADEHTTGYSLELLLCEIGETASEAMSVIIGSFPLSCKITTNGYMVVCDDKAVFFDNSGEEISTYMYQGMSLCDFDFDGDNLLLLFKDSGFNLSYNLICINSNSTIIFEHEFNSTVFDIELCQNRAFILSDNTLTALEEDYLAEIDFNGANHNCELLAYDVSSVYVCTDTSAPLIVFDN